MFLISQFLGSFSTLEVSAVGRAGIVLSRDNTSALKRPDPGCGSQEKLSALPGTPVEYCAPPPYSAQLQATLCSQIISLDFTSELFHL